MDDPRLLFVIRAVHCLSAAGCGLESEEVEGLKMILESIVVDGRGGHDGLQK